MRTLALLIVAAGLATAQETAKKEGAPGYLGLHVSALDAEARARFPGLPKDLTRGAVVIETVKGSPAEAAGFREGDVVIWFDGKEIGNLEDLIGAVQAKRAGERVAYRLRRGTGKIEGWLTLGQRPEPALEIVPSKEPQRPRAPRGEDRLDRPDKDVEELRKRLLRSFERAAPLRHPRSLGGWAHREEQAAKAARERGDMEKYSYHAIRLSVLKEMQEAEMRLPARRLDRIEKKLDAILARLERER
ncbi:MAG: S1C family serine protease [Planctomycetota bacterium]|jgi:hypothetical protein